MDDVRLDLDDEVTVLDDGAAVDVPVADVEASTLDDEHDDDVDPDVRVRELADSLPLVIPFRRSFRFDS